LKISRLIKAGAVAAGFVLAVTLAPPAQALWVPPGTAPLKDADGNANGCTASASLKLHDFGDDVGIAVFAQTDLSCPLSANIHRWTLGGGVWQVQPDGTLDVLGLGPGTFAVSASSQPTTGETGSGIGIGCGSQQMSGTHTYLFRTRVSAKVGMTYDDPNPFIARAGALATLTCP
jgi:hypothetical protein